MTPRGAVSSVAVMPMKVWSMKGASGCAPRALVTATLTGAPLRASIVGPPYRSVRLSPARE